jgi:hypothetical protein
MASEAERLREQAARCNRLAAGMADNSRNVLVALAAEYLVQAEALERPEKLNEE